MAIRRTPGSAAAAAATTALRSSHVLAATAVLVLLAAAGYGRDAGEFSTPTCARVSRTRCLFFVSFLFYAYVTTSRRFVGARLSSRTKGVGDGSDVAEKRIPWRGVAVPFRMVRSQYASYPPPPIPSHYPTERISASTGAEK